jgi:hypothetical protein
MKLTPNKLTKRDVSLQRHDAVNAIRWSWFKSISYQPHKYQSMFHNSWYESDWEDYVSGIPTLPKFARNRYTVAGRRGGKSESAGHEASAYMAAGPYRVMIGAPSYELGENEFQVILKDLETDDSAIYPVDVSMNVKGGDLDITTNIGSYCKVYSFDKPKKSAHGKEWDLILLSETALIDNIGGDTGVWNKTLMGASLSRAADLICPTTPQGQDDWLYPRFISGLPLDSKWRKFYNIDNSKHPYDPESYSLNWPAYYNTAGFIGDPFKMKEELPIRIFQEQILGWFVRWSGSIWLNDFCFNPENHVIDSFNIPSWWQRVEVIDPGYGGLFAWIAAVVNERGDVFVVDEYSASRTLYDKHANDILERRRLFYGKDYDPAKFIPVYVDPEDPRCAAELSQRGLQCISADNDVMAGFQSGAFRFSQGSLHIFNKCKQLIDSLKSHEWAKQTGDSAKRKEQNDRWKHFSDLTRYLNLAPIMNSEMPREDTELAEGVYKISDLMVQKQTSLGDIDFDQWRELHR